MRFDLGRVVVTPKASAALQARNLTLEDVLSRHQSGDWGEISTAAEQINEDALENGFALVSEYRTPGGDWVTVFTRPNRSQTLVHVAPKPARVLR